MSQVSYEVRDNLYRLSVISIQQILDQFVQNRIIAWSFTSVVAPDSAVKELERYHGLIFPEMFDKCEWKKWNGQKFVIPTAIVNAEHISKAIVSVCIAPCKESADGHSFQLAWEYPEQSMGFLSTRKYDEYIAKLKQLIKEINATT